MHYELPKSQPKIIYKEDLECEMVMVKIPKCMQWLDTYDEPIGDLDMMEDEVDNLSPLSTLQVLLSFEVYIPPVTYLEDVKETTGIPIEVEPLNETQLEDLGLNTCNDDIPLSSREVPSFDKLKPQPNLLPNCPPLDISLGDKRGPEPPIKPQSPNSFRIKVVDNCAHSSQLHTQPASFHTKGCILLSSPKYSKIINEGALFTTLNNCYTHIALAIPSFGKLLEEIHVTWTQFEKNQDKIAALHKVASKNCVQCMETASQFLATSSEHTSDGVKKIVTETKRNRLNGNPRRFSEATASGFLRRLLPSFEVYIPPVTYLEDVEETIGIPIEVEPLDETQLEDLGLNTCNHDIPLSSREVPSFDKLEPQPNPLPNCPPLDISLGDKRGPEPPIKPHSLDSFRIKKRDKIATLHEEASKNYVQCLETVSQFLTTPPEHTRDGVKKIVTASERNRLNGNPRRFGEATASGFLRHSGFARCNTIITSLKVLDEGFSSKNYVRKFLRALHPKWRAKVTSSDDETLTSENDDEEYVMAVRNLKRFFKRKGRFVRQLQEKKKSFEQRDDKKGKSDSKNEDEDKTNEETCLMA
ncbi:hypothetical protein Tco_1318472 [Tanacetum coccineum]